MSLTLTELTNKLGVAKPSISRKMTSIKGFRDKYTHKENNRLIINDEGVELISKLFNSGNSTNNKVNKDNVVVNELVNTLQSQLEVKDREIKKLTDLLEHEQQLRLQETLSGNNENIDGPVKDSKEHDISKHGKNWFFSLFGK